MRGIICIILLLFTFDLVESLYAPVTFVPLGSRAEIPCEGYRRHSNAKWLYKRKDNTVINIFHEDKGLKFHNKELWNRKNTLTNFTLEINPFTKLDNGTYVCQVCTEGKCTNIKEITLLPQYNTFPLTIISKGENFSYSCPSNLFLKVGWRFDAHGDNGSFPLNNNLADKSLLIIPSVQPSDAGKYSYWEETSTGQRLSVCSVTLCVLTVGAVKWSDSLQNCTLHCDVDLDLQDPLIVDKIQQEISVTEVINKLRSCVSFRFLSSTGKTYTTTLKSALSSTLSYSSASTAAEHAPSGPFTVPVLINIFLWPLIIIPALVVIIWLLQKRKDRNSSRHCPKSVSSPEGEDECTLIYSTLEVGRHHQQTVRPSDSECVYSEIKV